MHEPLTLHKLRRLVGRPCWFYPIFSTHLDYMNVISTGYSSFFWVGPLVIDTTKQVYLRVTIIDNWYLLIFLCFKGDSWYHCGKKMIRKRHKLEWLCELCYNTHLIEITKYFSTTLSRYHHMMICENFRGLLMLPLLSTLI